jgi:3-hydroxyacyl-[acyl-carrier-protein] dehydratase
MHDLSGSVEGKITAKFVFRPDFTGFKGHFPGKPVLPGVCKIQAVIAMAEKWYKKNICLNEISMAKFYAPVLCDQEITISFEKPDEILKGARIKGSVAGGGRKIADLHLKVSAGNNA